MCTQVLSQPFCKRLRDVAEFEFLDAPHALPFFYVGQPPAAGQPTCDPAAASAAQPAITATIVDGSGSAAGSQAAGVDSSQPPVTAALQAKPKRAWMVSRQLQEWTAQAGPQAMRVWHPAPAFVADGQHMQQTEGWAASSAALLACWKDNGPFDGLLGFSQVMVVFLLTELAQCLSPGMHGLLSSCGHHACQSMSRARRQQHCSVRSCYSGRHTTCVHRVLSS
jgi:hypothetical protein